MAILKRIKGAFLPRQENNKAKQSNSAKLNMLTSRERELFFLLIEGYTLKYCAEKMGIKYSAVNLDQDMIYQKLEIKSQAELIINYKDFAINENKESYE